MGESFLTRAVAMYDDIMAQGGKYRVPTVYNFNEPLMLYLANHSNPSANTNLSVLSGYKAGKYHQQLAVTKLSNGSRGSGGCLVTNSSLREKI